MEHRISTDRTKAWNWQQFAGWVKQRRQELNMNQTTAASKAGWTGENGKVSWARYEQGSPAREATVRRVAKALDTDAEKALAIAGLRPRSFRIAVEYEGCDGTQILDEILKVLKDRKINLIRTRAEGSEGGSKAFISAIGDVESLDVFILAMSIESELRERIHGLFLLMDSYNPLSAPFWNISVRHVEEIEHDSVFVLNAWLPNAPGALSGLISIITKKNLNILSLFHPPIPNDMTPDNIFLNCICVKPVVPIKDSEAFSVFSDDVRDEATEYCRKLIGIENWELVCEKFYSERDKDLAVESPVSFRRPFRGNQKIPF